MIDLKKAGTSHSPEPALLNIPPDCLSVAGRPRTPCISRQVCLGMARVSTVSAMGAKAQQGRRKQDVGGAPPKLSRAKRLKPVNHPAKFNRLQHGYVRISKRADCQRLAIGMPRAAAGAMRTDLICQFCCCCRGVGT